LAQRVGKPKEEGIKNSAGSKKSGTGDKGPKARPLNPSPQTLQPADNNGDMRVRIAERAYALYQRRGGHHGQDLDDWLAAEREVSAEHS
jgi:hypothetical protein